MTQRGPALCVLGRTAVLIYCKSRLFQPANPNTAPVNGTRWTAGVVLRLFASTSTEALLKSHLERAEASRRHLKQTWRKRRWTGGSTGAALCVFERVGLNVNCELRFPRGVLHSSSVIVISWQTYRCLDIDDEIDLQSVSQEK